MLSLNSPVTGVMVQYYKSCLRELWFFAHKINMNWEDENILIGRQIQNRSFSRERKGITIGPVSFDFLRDGERLIVCEVKKSRRLVEPQIYQLYYYLWFLKQKGIEAQGLILYPKEKKRKRVELTPEIEEELESIVFEIRKIVNLPTPPPIRKKTHCKGCSYYEFCRI